jgi:hypothetical protein
VRSMHEVQSELGLWQIAFLRWMPIPPRNVGPRNAGSLPVPWNLKEQTTSL